MRISTSTNTMTLLDAQTATGYGAAGLMAGQNKVDFTIQGVALTVLTVNFYKVSPLGGLYPLICSKNNSNGTITTAASTSTLPTAGAEVGASSPSTDIHTETSPTFRIAVDGDVGIAGSPTYHSITLTPTGLNSGAAIATAMQAAIRALGGIYAAVTVAYGTVYTITSGTQGAQSKVRIANGATNDVAAALKIGAANSATDTDGTGEAWTAEVPPGWSFQLGVSAITGTSVTSTGYASYDAKSDKGGNVSIIAGTNLMGKVGIDQVTANANEVVVKSITAGDNNIGNVDIASALPAGTNLLGKVGIDQTTPGTTNGVSIVGSLANGVTDALPVQLNGRIKQEHTFHTGVKAAANGTDMDVSELSAVGVYLSGDSTNRTWKFWGSIDGTNFTALVGFKEGDTTFSSAISTTGTAETWNFDVSIYKTLRIELDAITAGATGDNAVGYGVV